MSKTNDIPQRPHEPDDDGPPVGDLLGQHEALAIRLGQLFGRCRSTQPSIIAAGHGVFIRQSGKTYCVTILDQHLLLADCANSQVLGRYSSPAGICRHLASCGFQ